MEGYSKENSAIRYERSQQKKDNGTQVLSITLPFIIVYYYKWLHNTNYAHYDNFDMLACIYSCYLKFIDISNPSSGLYIICRSVWAARRVVNGPLIYVYS